MYCRWKRDESGRKIVSSESGKPQLQFIAIQRRDSGEWALPGVRIRYQKGTTGGKNSLSKGLCMK